MTLGTQGCPVGEAPEHHHGDDDVDDNTDDNDLDDDTDDDDNDLPPEDP